MATTAAEGRSPFPERLVNYEAAQAEHGERAEEMARMLTVGDPLADAVIAELDTLGKEGRQVLNRGLADGLDSLDSPPPAIAAFLRRVEAMPDWVAQEALTTGDRVSQLVPLRWSTLAFSGGSLSHTYSSPSIAQLLVQTGQLDKMAARRLIETNLWKIHTILPGGLLRGAPGYVQTAQVRLLHARVRATALKHGWETHLWGVPINQVDIARTWLDFTLVPYAFLASSGFVLTEDEQRSLYRYWWYVAYLLGLDESLFLDIHDHADAAVLADLLDSTIGAPDNNTRALTKALFNAQAETVANAPGAGLTKEAARDLLNALARQYHGDATADALGVPAAATTPVLPFISAANTQIRRSQTSFPEVAAHERAENIRALRAVAESVAGHTAYQKNVEAAV
ncbi:oxygenase MpaB family protein [Streptomyces tubercidicus]